MTDLEYARAEGNAIKNLYFKEWTYPAGYNFHIAGTKYLNGMGIILYGSDSGKVSHNLNGDYKRLTSLIGIDDYTKNFAARGRVTILGDGVEIFKSEQLTGGDPAKKMLICPGY
ncbi:NPCBM/NEW2 domain-containing protein [Paenibacillus oryzae]|uniref:NPCBM/NEW2 domain-containing protein n=1 Tax=Paenibacillus oryzae TaxID=1844972 RepID=UPI0009EF0EE0|nr:NPCBM/NEW2 domain-containing protein [Paenibacillus oryzae]